MNNINNGKLYRVNKTVARKTYNAGKPIYMLPCKTRLDNMWICPVKAISDQLTNIGTSNGYDNVIARNREFETVVNCFEYYNCNNELGRYTAFYLEGEC